MSDLIINWRFGAWHLQIHRNSPYLIFAKNMYWTTHTPPCWFERYK